MNPTNHPQNQKTAGFDKVMLAKLMLGSLGAGGALGLLGALGRQRRTILEDAESEDEPDLILPATTKQADFGSVLGGAVGLATGAARAVNRTADWFRPEASATNGAGSASDAGSSGAPSLQDLILGGVVLPAGFLGGLHMARSGFQAWRRKDLKERVRNEHEAYLKALADEARSTKKATTGAEEPRQPLGVGTLLLMGMAGLPFLSGITSGLLTDRILTQNFPVRKPQADRTRIKFEDEDEDTKQACDLSRDLLVHTVLSFEKDASDAGVAALVGAVAAGRLKDMESTMLKRGVDAAFDLAENCERYIPSDPLLKCAAVRTLVTSSLAAPASVMSAAVFSRRAPSWRAKGASVAEFPKLAKAFEAIGGLAVALHIGSLLGDDFEKVKEAGVAVGGTLSGLFDSDSTAVNGASTLTFNPGRTTRSDDGEVVSPYDNEKGNDLVDAAIAGTKSL